MRLFFGTYDSGRFWHRHEWRREVEVSRGLVREAWARYGGHGAFGGWYLSHETPDTSKRILDIHASLAGYTGESKGSEMPDLDLVGRLAEAGVLVVCEGRIRTPEHVYLAFGRGGQPSKTHGPGDVRHLVSGRQEQSAGG